MTTLLVIFGISLTLSLILSPLIGRLGTRFGAVDIPSSRKVHTKPIPRTGGLAIFIAFMLTLLISTFFMTKVSALLVLDPPKIFIFLGAAICFATGLVDDFHRLKPGIKFLFQVVSASVAFSGGLRIDQFVIMGTTVGFGFSSYFITIFWFILFINAVNLVDGLDGLATGVVFFTSAVMVVLSVMGQNFLSAMLFSALGGAVLGFLRYNFNPATIFLGDGGSYFLGYAVAGISIMGSVKSQVGAALLIPLLALGIPLFDTILSPLRRFVRGREMFAPDNGHIHHRLLNMGLTTRKAVFIIYLLTFILCLSAVIMVNIRDERAGLFLIVLGAGAILFIRKLGYFEYIASDKVYGWFRDFADETGLSRDRRSFLSLQIDMSRSTDFEDLWEIFCQTVAMLEFDLVELELNKKFDLLKTSNGNRLKWQRDDFNDGVDIENDHFLRLALPLIENGNESYGTLRFVKNLRRKPVSHHTFRRVEQLRRSFIGALEQLNKN